MSNASAMAVEANVESTGSLPSLEILGPRAEICFRRPDVHNRVQPEDIVELNRHFDRIEADPAVRVVVFSGSEKAFSSGFHLGVLRGSGDGARQFEALTDRLESLRPITIAKVNGPVYGGATDLVMSCDFRYGRIGVQMFMPAAKLGLHYYPHGLRRWVSRLGLGAAKKLFLTSSTISHAEMLAIGYLDEVHESARLDHAVNTLVDKILAQAPTVSARMKQVLNAVARQEYDDEFARGGFELSLGSQDLREGLASWAEKRIPNFKGA
ncbi:enoyl-CoA hydratase/isomerase family protein (plasmid) [Cupriavidus sp. P-10]|uniref:enoyl-CoA hydratase/isomerase family protein n=1 Tax=unclassified Cupriavidus TaxID=2640874 RepID=UPI000E2E7A53|nr:MULTISPECIES: enoyl-CoA hydratase/isomerase family protein [unclassified Cupriavidus]BDB29985.1 enoyl-CoA hydratase/isomerase family protein [Cupriavidus sp. P-10]